MDHFKKIIGEVKNYAPGRKVALTNQLKDDIMYAAQEGYQMELHVRSGTQFTAPLQQYITNGTIKVITF